MAETGIRLCIAVWDVLAQIHRLVGRLPVGTPDTLKHSTSQELFHAARATLNDESIWQALKPPFKREIHHRLVRLIAEGVI